ncbi:hypothetical protein CR513_11196, partial [Mucuna pruriens]
MDIPQNRRWMYCRLDDNKLWINEFTEGLHKFLEFAIAQEKFQLQVIWPENGWQRRLEDMQSVLLYLCYGFKNKKLYGVKNFNLMS